MPGVPGAVEDNVEPVVLLEPLRGAIFVAGQSNFADTGAAFDLDEANLDGGLGVFGMRTS